MDCKLKTRGANLKLIKSCFPDTIFKLFYFTFIRPVLACLDREVLCLKPFLSPSVFTPPQAGISLKEIRQLFCTLKMLSVVHFSLFCFKLIQMRIKTSIIRLSESRSSHHHHLPPRVCARTHIHSHTHSLVFRSTDLA